MTATIQAAGVVPFDAPLPAPRPDDLLAVAPPQDLAENRWLRGAWSGGYPPGPAFTHDNCGTGTDRAKFAAGPIPSQRSALFTVYQPAFCTAQTIGPDPDWFIRRLEDIFVVYERAAVERMLASGDGHDDLGPYLGNENMRRLTTDATDPLSALRLLENAIAAQSSGIIHASPSTVTAWDSLHVTCMMDGLTCTRRGTPIAVGPGYIGVVPDGAAPLEPDEQWAFASGPIEILRQEEIQIPASTYEQLLDRSLNDVYVLAERTYLFNWIARQNPDDNDQIQAGVLINEGRVGCCSVDGGSP